MPEPGQPGHPGRVNELERATGISAAASRRNSREHLGQGQGSLCSKGMRSEASGMGWNYHQGTAQCPRVCLY